MAGNGTADAVVVGAGVIGMAAAEALARRGLRVIVVERARPGAGASGATFAWVNASSKTADETYHRLNAAGVAAYAALAAEHGAERVGFHASGALLLAPAEDAAASGALAAQARRLAAWGYPVHTLDAAALAECEPALAAPEGWRALHAPGEGWLDVPRFLDFLAGRIAARSGAVWAECTAQELLLDDAGRVAGVATTAGSVGAPAVLVAAGAETPAALAALTGFEGFATRFPVRLVPGLLVATPAPGDAGEGVPHRLGHVLWSLAAGELHLRPDRGGGLLLGSEETDGLVAAADTPAARREGARRLLAAAARVVPALVSGIAPGDCRAVVGMRACPEDGRSIAGPLPGAEGLHIAVTHSGVTLAPVLGELLAEAIAGGRTPAALAPFTPDRLPGFR